MIYCWLEVQFYGPIGYRLSGKHLYFFQHFLHLFLRVRVSNDMAVPGQAAVSLNVCLSGIQGLSQAVGMKMGESWAVCKHQEVLGALVVSGVWPSYCGWGHGIAGISVGVVIELWVCRGGMWSWNYGCVNGCGHGIVHVSEECCHGTVIVSVGAVMGWWVCQWDV